MTTIPLRPAIAAGLLALGVLLAGCGKKGPPEAPGPNDTVTYPRSYPPPD
jgi:predicted small lipoprotein YifL